MTLFLKRLFNKLLLISFFIAFPVFAADINSSDREPLLLSVDLNGEMISTVMLGYYDKKTQQLYVPEEALTEWSVKNPSEMPIDINNKQYYELNWFHGVRYRIDKRTLQLNVQMPTKWFNRQGYDASLTTKNALIIRPKNTGLFLNYNVNAQSTSQVSAGNFGATTELGVFSPGGIGSSSFLLQNLGQQNQVDRLDTYWRFDQPEKMRTIILGDSTTSTDTWSQSVRFAGFEIATNTQTRPNQVTFPLPAVTGAAVVPSAVSLLANSTVLQKQNVQPGNYVINNIPTITGAGNIEMVTQNILGQQQMTVVPYYVAPELRKKGLTTYSWDLGYTRDNYGLNSFDYGNPVTTVTFDHGLTNTLTIGSHFEILPSQQTAGLSTYYLLHHYFLLEGAVAGSQFNEAFGDLAQVGISRNANPFSYGVNSTWTSPTFMQLGYQSGQQPPAQTMQAFVGYDRKKLGSFGLAYTLTASNSAPATLSAATVPNSNFLTLNYNRGLPHHMNFSGSVITDFSGQHNNQIYASLVWMIDAVRSLTYNFNQGTAGTQNTLDFNQNRAGTLGFGYQLLATDVPQQSAQFQGSGNWQTQYGGLSGLYSRQGSQNNYAASATGSAIYFAKHVFMTQSMDSSFALVHASGVTHIPVYYQNQYVGKTDGKGNLVIQNLLPYQKNKIKLDFKKMDLDTDIAADKAYVIPYYHSGVLVNFTAKKVRSVAMHLQLDSHSYVPAGAYVTLDNASTAEEMPIGYFGTLFIQNETDNIVSGVAHWGPKHCRFRVTVPLQKTLITQLGNVQCVVY